jgi:probable LLM family oxidoreductase
MAYAVELGLDTFGDVTVDEQGTLLTQAQVLRHVVEEGRLADQVGLHFLGVGEHHRKDFSISAPEVVLAAIASVTKQIHLGSSVTVLSSDDPVRVFQRFSTLNAISNGRAEVILGRGSFTESYPLFGFDLSDYEELFEEKLNLFAELLKNQPINWQGKLRPSFEADAIYPPVASGTLSTWIAVGGSPQSVVRAAYYGLPLMLAIIGGNPSRFLPYADLYRQSLERFEKPLRAIGVHSPGHVAETDEQAKEEIWPHYEGLMNRIGAERGWAPIGRAHFEREAGPDGALFVGSPETVAAKIVGTVKALGLTRFDMKYSNGTLPHGKLMKSIELYGTKVAPLVHNELGGGGLKPGSDPEKTGGQTPGEFGRIRGRTPAKREFLNVFQDLTPFVRRGLTPSVTAAAWRRPSRTGARRRRRAAPCRSHPVRTAPSAAALPDAPGPCPLPADHRRP